MDIIYMNRQKDLILPPVFFRIMKKEKTSAKADVFMIFIKQGVIIIITPSAINLF